LDKGTILSLGGLQEKVYANAEESVKGYRAYVAEQQELMRMRKLEEEQVTPSLKK
jgi:hypothetical protein